MIAQEQVKPVLIKLCQKHIHDLASPQQQLQPMLIDSSMLLTIDLLIIDITLRFSH
jgi:hypothetical protein